MFSWAAPGKGTSAVPGVEAFPAIPLLLARSQETAGAAALPHAAPCTQSLWGDASSAPNHLGSVGARSTIPPSLFPRLTLLQYFFKIGKDVFTSFVLCFSSTPPFFFGKMDAEDSRAAPAVLETGRLHPGTVQALFECVSGAGFRSRRE